MEYCSKCGGVMLLMKIKKTLLPDSDKLQGFKCSRCGYYLEKPQLYTGQTTQKPDSNNYFQRPS
jgi:DNA-directed RNA polymerase subunit M/transcription elongation factor TFIIS